MPTQQKVFTSCLPISCHRAIPSGRMGSTSERTAPLRRSSTRWRRRPCTDARRRSYEGALRDESLLLTVLAAKPLSYLLIVDESYVVKNPATARARSLARIRPLCERAVVLCGTPAPNSPGDIVNQIDIADGGIAFASRGPTSRVAAYDEVVEGLRDAIFLRRLKEDVLPDIPSKQVEKIYIDLARAQRALYAQVHAELVLDVRSVDDRQFKQKLASFLTRRVRLLQICSNPQAIDPFYDEVPSKLRALDRLLLELVEHGKKKIVIWSYFRASLPSPACRQVRRLFC